MTQLEAHLGRAINYEDGPQSYTGSQTAFTLEQPPGWNAMSMAPAIDSLIKANNLRGYTGAFERTSVEGLSFVIPVDKTRRILDSPVSFWYQQRSAADTVDLILSGVSQGTNAKVSSNGPPMLMITSKVTVGATKEPARDALAKLLLQLGPRTGYQLLCDKAFHQCFLNIHVVPQ